MMPAGSWSTRLFDYYPIAGDGFYGVSVGVTELKHVTKSHGSSVLPSGRAVDCAGFAMGGYVNYVELQRAVFIKFFQRA